MVMLMGSVTLMTQSQFPLQSALALKVPLVVVVTGLGVSCTQDLSPFLERGGMPHA